MGNTGGADGRECAKFARLSYGDMTRAMPLTADGRRRIFRRHKFPPAVATRRAQIFGGMESCFSSKSPIARFANLLQELSANHRLLPTARRGKRTRRQYWL